MILIGGAMCFPFLCAQGHDGRRLAVRRRGRRARSPGAREATDRRTGQRSSCPVDLVLADRFARRRRAACAGRGRRARRDGWAWTSARERRAPTPSDHRRGRHRLLERPDGRVRARAVRGRHPRGRRGGRRRPPGVTVVGGGDSAAALAQFGLADAVDPPLDRRRRDARADRGQELPGIVLRYSSR